MEADVATHKITPITVPIAIGATQSAAIYTKDAIAGYVQCPADAIAGAMNFELSEDGATFFAAEPVITIANGVGANKRVPIPAAALSARYTRIVAGATQTGTIKNFVVYLKS